MNSPSVNLLKLLEAAAELVGGEQHLAVRLGIHRASLRMFMADLEAPGRRHADRVLLPTDARRDRIH